MLVQCLTILEMSPNHAHPKVLLWLRMGRVPIDLKPAYYSHMSLSYKSCSVCCTVANLSMHVASLFKYHLWYDRFALNVGLDEDGRTNGQLTEIRPDSGYMCAKHRPILSRYEGIYI